MPRVLGAVLLVVFGLLLPVPGARAGELIFQPFEAGALNPSERRLLQTALAASGDYSGALDGTWGQVSQVALDAYARREFQGAPLNVHAATAVLAFLDEIDRDAWDVSFLPGLGVSLALPLAVLGPAEAEDGGTRRWSRAGTLTVLTHRFADARAADWHAAAASASRGAGRLQTVRTPRLMVTAGGLGDGRRFYTRSDLVDGQWATVFVASGPDQARLLNLIASSIAPGQPQTWDLPAGGRLSTLVGATTTFLDELARVRPAPTPVSAPAIAATPPAAGAPGEDSDATSTGSAFYLGARTLVTAQHVIGDCAGVTLADGSALTVLAADPELDVAVLSAPRPAARWLSLADGRTLHLGERVHAAGFPYYSIAGTSLHLTSGNVSALAGVDDDRRFFSFTAPVQPGNSGGPLIDAHGAVLGLVVARLSEDYIAETTGSLPQNVNYAVGETELARFLSRNGVSPGGAGLDGYDADDGVPDGFDAAVVPIVCH